MQHRPTASMRRDGAGRILEWFSPGITPEPATQSSDLSCTAGSSCSGKNLSFVNLWCADVHTEGWKDSTWPWSVCSERMRWMRWRRGRSDPSDVITHACWLVRVRDTSSGTAFTTLGDVCSHNSTVPAAGTVFSSLLLLLEIIHDCKLIHSSSLCVLCTFPFSLQHNIMQHHHESCQTASWVAAKRYPK